MGIPYYFQKVVNEFHPLANVPIRLNNVDLFCLDFNSVIHNSANAFVKRNKHATYAEIIDNIIQSLIDLINIVPAQTIYVAIDGLCPMAKIIQQRKRRFMNAPANVVNATEWNSLIVTPGTSFMKQLDEGIHDFVKKNEKLLNIVFSPSSQEGEGEQKIFDYIKEKYSIYDNPNIVIYGLDADLIMLSLIQSQPNIRLLRENSCFHIASGNKKLKTNYITLNIGDLRKAIESKYEINVDEYVILCFLLGNDFIPSVSYLSIKDDGIEKILKAYRQCSKELPLLNNKELNIISLYQIFKNLYNMLDESLYIPTNYYALYFKEGIVEKNIVNDYLDGVFWCYNYYFTRKQFSLTWYYKHNYSPTVLSLTKYCNMYQYYHIEDNNLNIYTKMSKNSDIQLFLVLPIQCHTYIQDDNIKSLATDIKYGFVHCFPIEFRKESFLKKQEWQHIFH